MSSSWWHQSCHGRALSEVAIAGNHGSVQLRLVHKAHVLLPWMLSHSGAVCLFPCPPATSASL